jgi:hypothetical protein
MTISLNARPRAEGDHCYAEYDSSGNARTPARKLTRRCAASRRNRITILAALNREIDDWAKLLGDAIIVTPLLDRLMHHGHLLKFVGKSWRLKESAERLAKGRQTA